MPSERGTESLTAPQWRVHYALSMSLSPSLSESPLRQAERALRKPSSTVWLQSVCVRTTRFDEALNFYVRTLGLTLDGVSIHPITSAPRAQMLDAEGNPVFELVEAQGDAVRGVHELAFGMPRRTWHLLRARLSMQGVNYTEAGQSLWLEDVDGTTLRIEALNLT